MDTSSGPGSRSERLYRFRYDETRSRPVASAASTIQQKCRADGTSELT